MKINLLIFLTIVLASSCHNVPDENPSVNIIPKPVSIQFDKGSFTFNHKTRINNLSEDPEADKIAAIFTEDITALTGITLKTVKGKASKNQIILSLDQSGMMHPEGYKLRISPKKIFLSATNVSGLFYGLQSVKQLLMTTGKPGNEINIPTLDINDYPRFQWRGMHLDVARHFMTKDSVMRYIDFLAMYKFNQLHIHFTDDQGWRIEIKKYPALTETGAWRKETIVGRYRRNQPGEYDGIPHGGYYTHEDIREIVTYAADRFINLIPEIEMPGHAQAAIAAYPQLGVTGKPIEVRREWGISPNIFNPTEETFRFLEGVLEEVMTLFPSEFIHIGGDEAIKDQWKASRAIQKQIRQLGLKDENELQSWFIRRIEKFLNSRGRRLIGWDEILEGGLAPNATVMSWRGTKGGIAAAEMGHDVVMSPYSHCYFDYYQADPETEPLAIGGYLPLENVYSFEPIPAELDKDKAKHILGAQGNVWTEYMKTFRDVEYMVFPRITALSEVVWSQPENKDFSEFSQRVKMQVPIFEALDINYAKSGMP